MKNIFYFLLAGLAWVFILLTVDLEADLLKVSIISAVASVITLVVVKSLRRPLRKFYLRNFSKSYKMNSGKK